MNIGNFLRCLKTFSDDVIIENADISEFGSDRGDYRDFYIRDGNNCRTTVREIIDLIENEVIGEYFIGYKGGEFTMDESSQIKLGNYGCCGNEIDGFVVSYDYLKGVIVYIKKLSDTDY